METLSKPKIYAYFAQEMKAAGMTNATVCEKAKVDSGCLSRFLQGKKKNPSLDFVVKIFRALELNLEKIKELEIY